MWKLYQFTLCPFSRKVRLALAEKGVPFDLATALPWAPGEAFDGLNHFGRTPVLHDADRDLTLVDSQAICEFLEETEDRTPLVLGNALQRAEIRKLVALFDQGLFADVTHPLMHEKMKKRLVLRQAPDSGVLRSAMRLLHEHLEYIDWLVGNRRWLAGAQLSLADFAAAAQISVIDYLGALDWTGHDEAHSWYRVMKSRPSFRPLLAEKMDGLPAPRTYADVNS
jgi:glutathione S-transferase